MAYSKAALKQARTAFNRAASQYRRYYGVDTSQYLEGVHTPKGYERALAQLRRDVEAEKIAAAVAEREAREREEQRQREFEARLSVENFKTAIERAPRQLTRSASGYGAAEKSARAVLSIIDAAITEHGYVDTWERLQPYASDFDDRIEKLVIAAYSEDYNTNSFWGVPDEQGETGRSNYVNDMEKLAADLGIQAGAIIYTVWN